MGFALAAQLPVGSLLHSGPQATSMMINTTLVQKGRWKTDVYVAIIYRCNVAKGIFGGSLSLPAWLYAISPWGGGAKGAGDLDVLCPDDFVRVEGFKKYPLWRMYLIIEHTYNEGIVFIVDTNYDYFDMRMYILGFLFLLYPLIFELYSVFYMECNQSLHSLQLIIDVWVKSYMHFT